MNISALPIFTLFYGKNQPFEFYIDGELMETTSTTITGNMRPAISDYNNGGPAISVDWIRVSPYLASGSYTSRIFDRGSDDGWGDITWSSFEPTGTDISVFVNTGNTPEPDGSWTGFSAVTQGLTIGGTNQYLQYRADLSTSDTTFSPILEDITITCLPGPDLTPPIITNVNANPNQDGVSATITWDTDELANSLVEYGTVSTTLSESTSNGTLTLSHNLELTGLSTETTYYFRVTSEDAAFNSASEPISPSALSFTTPIPSINCFTDQTTSDFELGTLSDTYISIVDDGEVILNPATAAEFTVLPPISEWNSYQWSGGTSTVSTGILTVDGARYNSDIGTPFYPGSTMEFYATIGAESYQHIGFGGGNDATTTNGIYTGHDPWAMFGTGNQSSVLKVRTSLNGSTSSDVDILGSYLGTSHLYRIEWTADSINYYIDGVLKHTETATITNTMRPAISDYTLGGSNVQVDWIHVTPFSSPGIFESRIYDAGTPRLWGIASWTTDIPTNTTLLLSQRQSNSNITILSEPWISIPSNGATIGGTSQFIQYKADFTTSDPSISSVLKDLVITCSDPGNMAPIISINPVSQLVCEGETISFISAATGSPIPSVQWQESEDGIIWSDINGATNDTLTFVTEAIDDGLQYQAVWTNSEGSATSHVATLNVNPKPTATIVAVNPTICDGEDIQLQLTAASGLAPYELEVNGTLYSNVEVNDLFATYKTGDYSIWQLSDVPENPAATDNLPIEIGVKFRSTVPGYIKGIRYYKGILNTGIHIGTLWTNTGTSMATATFVNETTSGWQEVQFSTPQYIAANTTYVASYYSPDGYFAIDLSTDPSGGLTSAVVNGNLTALASGTDGPNGVYLYGEGGGFPGNGSNANYWVDVVFEEEITLPITLTSVTDANNCTNTEENIINVTINPSPTGTLSGPVSECPDSPINLTFDATAGTNPYSLIINGSNYTNILGGVPFYSNVDASPELITNIWNIDGGPDGGDGASYEMGVKFQSSIAGLVKGIRFYKHPANTGTHTGTLWSSNGTLLETATFTNETNDGWQEVIFANPVTILPNTTYIASYYTPNGHYAFTTNYFTSQNATNGPLTALQSGVDGLNGIYNPGVPGFPTNSYNDANYWVDVIFSSSADYNFTLTEITDNNGCNTSNITGNTINVSVAKCGEFQAFLQGTYDSINNIMNVGLAGNIPLSQPYNVTPWFYDGTESVSAMDVSVVDWILVELRSDTETTFERKAALLLDDGSIVQYNNLTQGVHFENTIDGNSYYVVVYHRNHMPVMSTNVLVLENNPVPFSFTDLANCYGGGAVLLETTNPAYGLIAGDINSNGLLSYSGPGNDRGMVIARIVDEVQDANINSVATGYFDEDILMDYDVKYIGSNNDRAIIPTNLATLTGLSNLNSTYQSVVPGFTTKSSEMNDGPIHIFLEETDINLQVKIITDENISKGIVDNIQFTLSWDIASNGMVTSILKNAQSSFALMPQGQAKEYEGRMYQVYVTVVPVELPDPFSINDEVTLISFNKDQLISLGSSINITDDSYTENQNGNYYISLLGKDFTGKIQTSTLGITELSENGLSVYPNPVTSGLVQIKMMLKKAQEVNVFVLDIHGKLVHSKAVDVNGGLSINQLKLPGIPNGIYYIKVQAENMNAIRKLIVL